MLTQSRLKELLHYDPTTGIFTRVVRLPKSNVKIGAIAGSLTQGYRNIRVDGPLYRAHRLAWLYVYGTWPAASVDHINGVGDDNRICNLRDVSHSVNLQNRKRAGVNNKTGLLGASPIRGKFQASINVGGRQTYLGVFATPELAHAAYLAAKRNVHPGNTL